MIYRDEKRTFGYVCDPGYGMGGIFYYLGQETSIPWRTALTSLQLDLYFCDHVCGERYISRMVEKYISESTGRITTDGYQTIARILAVIYGDKWNKLWATLSYEYDPIENYKMTEEMDGDTTDITYGNTETDTMVHGKTQTRTDLLTEVSETGIQGFNSASYSASDKYTTDNTGTQTFANTGTDTNTKARTGKDTHERNYTLTRSGNIGVTTSQQMIQSERDLDMWNFMIDVVFPDVRKVMTLSVY